MTFFLFISCIICIFRRFVRPRATVLLWLRWFGWQFYDWWVELFKGLFIFSSHSFSRVSTLVSLEVKYRWQDVFSPLVSARPVLLCCCLFQCDANEGPFFLHFPPSLPSPPGLRISYYTLCVDPLCMQQLVEHSIQQCSKGETVCERLSPISGSEAHAVHFFGTGRPWNISTLY